jgi:hypothetical protein
MRQAARSRLGPADVRARPVRRRARATSRRSSSDDARSRTARLASGIERVASAHARPSPRGASRHRRGHRQSGHCGGLARGLGFHFALVLGRSRSRLRRGGSRGRRATRGRLLDGSRLRGLRRGRGRRRGCRRRVGDAPRRKQARWVHVVVVGAEPDPEVHVRHRVLGLARRPGVGDRLTLGHLVAAPDAKVAEVHEGRLVPARGRDGDRGAVRGKRPCERHLTGRRRSGRGRIAERDVDPAVLAARVLVGADREPTEHRAVRRPRPRPGGRAGDERPHEHRSETDGPSRCLAGEHGSTVARPCARSQRN